MSDCLGEHGLGEPLEASVEQYPHAFLRRESVGDLVADLLVELERAMVVERCQFVRHGKLRSAVTVRGEQFRGTALGDGHPTRVCEKEGKQPSAFRRIRSFPSVLSDGANLDLFGQERLSLLQG